MDKNTPSRYPDMNFQLTMLQIFNFLSSCMKILGIHPPKDDGNTSCMTYFLWWFYLSNYVVILISTIYTRYITTSDVITLSYSWMEILLLLDSIITMIQCKFQKNHTKVSDSFYSFYDVKTHLYPPIHIVLGFIIHYA